MRSQTLLLLLGSILVSSGCENPPDSSLVGSTREFQVETLQSGDLKTSLKSLRGKPVLIDFWATWCGPCRELTPYVEGIYQKYRDKGLQAMAISNENRTDVQRFEKSTPHTMPVYIDFDDSASSAYGVTGLPTIVVINKDGAVTYTTTGFVSPQQAAQEIEAAVAKAVQ